MLRWRHNVVTVAKIVGQGGDFPYFLPEQVRLGLSTGPQAVDAGGWPLPCELSVSPRLLVLPGK